MRTKIKIPIDKAFIFRETIRSHGWIDLLPNFPADGYDSFSRVEQLPTGKVILADVSYGQMDSESAEILIEVEHKGALTHADTKAIKDKIAYALRLNEDLGDFYALCKKMGPNWRDFQHGNGYLFRSPSVFEDLVKVICTTNIQWGGTKRMVSELVEAFGAAFPLEDEKKTFPSPDQIAAVPLDKFKEQVKLGYRAGYVYGLACSAAGGEIDLAELRDTSLPSAEVRKRLLSIKGVGNYAAASMMMLLGRYDLIPVDTVFRDFMKSTHFKDKEFSEEAGLQVYEKWGEWKYLAYWFEMLQHYRSSK